MTDIRQVKRELRTKYRSIRENMDPVKKRECDLAIFKRFTESVFYQESDVLLCFVSTGIEVETRGILEQAFADGKTVAVPKCLDKNGKMDFFIIQGMDELYPAMFSLYEPDPSKAPRLGSYRNSVCVIPAMAFDAEGYRIGFGKGYYDRFLQKYTGKKVGICYNSCIAGFVPRGRYDVAADYIVTPKYIITAQKPESRVNAD